MSNERQLRYTSDDNQYEGQNLFGWDNTNLKGVQVKTKLSYLNTK